MKIAGKTVTLRKALPWILIVGGTIGLLCATLLTYDTIRSAQSPAFRPNCDINPIISCGDVMTTDQAHAFGFPNPFLGIASFAVVLTTGVVLIAGAADTLKRWYWLGLEAGALFGVGFVHWLFFESVYRIGALCPYCMVTWVVTITTFWYVTLYNIQAGHIVLPASLKPAAAFARKHHLDILVIWFVIIAALILKHFWYYYGHHL